MTRNRFVSPTIVRLALTDGDWVEIKERLDFGERQALAASQLRQSGSLMADNVSVDLNMAGYKIERMVMYLLDWSFRDADDRAVPVTRAAITALDPETADEIDAAIDAHLETLTADPTTPKQTSASP